MAYIKAVTFSARAFPIVVLNEFKIQKNYDVVGIMKLNIELKQIEV